MSQANCPLCHAPAAFTQIDSQRKHFKCVSCTEFVVWHMAERWLRDNRAPNTLDAYAANVRATTNPNFIYVLRPARPDETPTEFVGEPQVRSEALSSQ